MVISAGLFCALFRSKSLSVQTETGYAMFRKLVKQQYRNAVVETSHNEQDCLTGCKKVKFVSVYLTN
jgi:hypothetical protein